MNIVTIPDTQPDLAEDVESLLTGELTNLADRAASVNPQAEAKLRQAIILVDEAWELLNRRFKMPPKQPTQKTANPCECADPGCPAHKGASYCTKAASTTIFRVDMEDRTGTMMCQECADDAMESGLFRENEN